MSLKSILASKDKFSQNLVDNFNSQWVKMTPEIRKGLVSIFRAGDYSTESIQAVFQQAGFNNLTDAVAGQYSKMLSFSEQLSKEMGYKFILTNENIALFDQVNTMNFERLINGGISVASDLQRFAIQSQIEGRKFNQIAAGLNDIFETAGRRLNTEIYTGIRNFESSIDKVSQQNAGIEKFVYSGPVDAINRDACRGTLSDNRQSTGWTMEEIENSDTPFVDRGGWNCRHRWLPFIVDAPVYTEADEGKFVKA